ncbi:MAG: SMC-Scp complex subunit ScpB [Pyrinomonadaceae bacterium]
MMDESNNGPRPAAAAEDDDQEADDQEFAADEAEELEAFEELEEDDDDEDEIIIYDADREDAAERALNIAPVAPAAAEEIESGADDNGELSGVRDMAEMMSVIEALIFVSEEPLSTKMIADVLKEDRGWIAMAIEELSKEFNERNSGLMMREVAGGWQIATRPEHHEHVRAFLRSRPSAKLSLAALETLAVIAYKQPITVPEILDIRGVQSSSAISTLLNKRLIIPKGRKETVGRPIMYGTSKDFLLQFGLKDLTELPSMEDFEDLAGTSI